MISHRSGSPRSFLQENVLYKVFPVAEEKRRVTLLTSRVVRVFRRQMSVAISNLAWPNALNVYCLCHCPEWPRNDTSRRSDKYYSTKSQKCIRIKGYGVISRPLLGYVISSKIASRFRRVRRLYMYISDEVTLDVILNTTVMRTTITSDLQASSSHLGKVREPCVMNCDPLMSWEETITN